MRCMTCALAVLVAVLGCKNQSTGTLTNPFLTPDRVPPPSTRVLAPGTAQPYYPGAPMPGAVTAPPAGAVGAPAYAAPPATSLPATPLPGATPPPATPPGGWGAPSYSPQSNLSPGNATLTTSGDAVTVPGDQQGLRFAAASDPATGQGAVTPTPQDQSAADALALAPAPTMRMPIQSLLPLSADQPGASGPTRLQTRELTPADYAAPVAGAAGVRLASAGAPRDGFRPLGSSTAAAAATDDDSAFRPPSIYGNQNTGSTSGEPSADDAAHFAAGENYESLRGQLEYWPTTGEWTLRYLPAGSAADSLGGRVMIDNPQVLANLQPGELVTLRGVLFAKSNDAGAATPVYRVSAVQRQRL